MNIVVLKDPTSFVKGGKLGANYLEVKAIEVDSVSMKLNLTLIV